MALTVTINGKSRFNNARLHVGTVTGDSSYATGGYTITPNDFGLNTITGFIAGPSSTGRVFTYNAATGKLMAFQSAGSAAAMAEVPNATDISAAISQVMVYGK